MIRRGGGGSTHSDRAIDRNCFKPPCWMIFFLFQSATVHHVTHAGCARVRRQCDATGVDKAWKCARERMERHRSPKGWRGISRRAFAHPCPCRAATRRADRALHPAQPPAPRKVAPPTSAPGPGLPAGSPLALLAVSACTGGASSGRKLLSRQARHGEHHGCVPACEIRAKSARLHCRRAHAHVALAHTRLHDLELEIVVGGEVRKRHAREPLRRRRANVRHKDQRLHSDP